MDSEEIASENTIQRAVFNWDSVAIARHNLQAFGAYRTLIMMATRL